MIWARSCLIISVLFFYSCYSPQHVPDEQLLAQIDGKAITIQDFIRRAEYSIRPVYCRNSNYIHKKIVLNSLIAEKLLSLEMQGRDDKQLNSPSFLSFIKGRKEQAMRQIFYHENFFSKVTVTEDIIQKNYELAGRTIKVNYLNLPDMEIVEKVANLKREGFHLDSIYLHLWEGDVPVRDIGWFDREPEEIHDRLFQNNIKKGQLLGPFKTENNTYLIMEVAGWTDQLILTEMEKELRWSDTKERLTEKKAKKRYLNYVRELMSGFEMNLNSQVFNNYASIVVDYYLKDNNDKEQAINQMIWENEQIVPLNDFDQSKELDPSSILFSYRDKDWDVASFNKLLQSHPLVFRKRKMKRSEFRSQLKFAIADLLRDVEITNRCYDLGLDNDWRVIANENQWYDAYASKRHIQLSFPEPVETQQILDYYNPLIDSLQQVYSKEIHINTRVFEELDLTATDMMVTHRGLPYPIVVPSFPIVTTDDRLDYGSKLK